MGPTMNTSVRVFVLGTFPDIHNPKVTIDAMINTPVIKINVFLISFLSRGAIVIYGFVFYKDLLYAD